MTALTTSGSPPGDERSRPRQGGSGDLDQPTVPVRADVLHQAALLVVEAGERADRAKEFGQSYGWHLGYVAGRAAGWAAGHAAGLDAGGAGVLAALRAGWPDLGPARRLVSREYVDLLDGPTVAVACTCSCCRRRDGRAA